MAKKQLTRKITWIRDRDVNGNYGYRNIKTGEFRTTLPNSKEENRQNQVRLNKAVLRTYSTKQQYYKEHDAKRKNHSDETIKKQVKVPYITTDKYGNFQEGIVKILAPGEDSAQIDNTLEGLLIGDKVFRLGSGITKLALSKTGSNGLAHWARNSLVNEVAKDLTKQLSSKTLIGFSNNLAAKQASLGKPINLGIFQKPLYNITSMSSTNTEIPKDVQLALFNQGRLALMQRYNNNPVWENLAKQAGLSDDLVSSFRDYATKLLSTKQSPEPHLAPLIVRESPGQYSQSVVVPSKTLPLKRYLDYKINSNPQPHYTGIHEGAHMSTLNYDPATEYRAYGKLILNPKAKTAITKLMNNADDLANQLEVDPQKIKILRDNLIRVKGKTPTEADQIIQHQIQYLKTGQETRSRGLAAQEWMQDNHSVNVPDNVDNGVNFFTDKSLRNVWRNMAVGLPLIWGTSKMIQNNTQEK